MLPMLAIHCLACFSRNDEGDFALQLPFTHLSLNLAYFSPENLLVNLCQLSSESYFSISKDIQDVIQCFGDPVSLKNSSLSPEFTL